MQPVTLFVLSVLLGSTAPAQGGAGEGEGTGGRRVYVARMEDEAITPGTARYLQRAIRQAEETNAE